MSDKRDYYEVLGVERNAAEKDIKAAYRKKALEFHPDRNKDDPEAESKFKEAAEAYDVLGSDEKRKRYDQFGHAGVGGDSFSGTRFTNIEDIFEAFGDVFGGGLFGDFFGGQRRTRGGKRPGRDLRIVLELALEEVELRGDPAVVPIDSPITASMVWAPGRTFSMGSDAHYPEEATAHRVHVDGFFIDSYPVTNREFHKFVEATGYLTFAELPPDPAKYPGAIPEMLHPGSAVFVKPRREEVPQGSWWQFIAGANWRNCAVAASWLVSVSLLDSVVVSVKNRGTLIFVQFREYFLNNFSGIQKQQKTGTGTVASC
jgi:hypothetical protein